MTEPKTFSALSETTSDEDLELIPVTFKGLRLRPEARPGVELPAEVKVKLADWLEVPVDERKAIIAEHQLLTTWTETYHFLPFAPTGVLDDLMRSVGTDSMTGEQVFNAPSLNRFMTGAMIDSEVGRFQALTRDKNRILPIDTLGDAAIWLAKQMTDRPSGPSSD
jgi:hypothetical protein